MVRSSFVEYFALIPAVSLVQILRRIFTCANCTINSRGGLPACALELVAFERTNDRSLHSKTDYFD